MKFKIYRQACFDHIHRTPCTDENITGPNALRCIYVDLSVPGIPHDVHVVVDGIDEAYRVRPSERWSFTRGVVPVRATDGWLRVTQVRDRLHTEPWRTQQQQTTQFTPRAYARAWLRDCVTYPYVRRMNTWHTRHGGGRGALLYALQDPTFFDRLCGWRTWRTALMAYHIHESHIRPE